MATDWRMIHLVQDGPLAIVTLRNPPLHVLHPQMVAELEACFTALATDPEVVVAILTGQGERAFCAGFDIKEFPNLMAPGGAERLTRAARQPGEDRASRQTHAGGGQRSGARGWPGTVHGL